MKKAYIIIVIITLIVRGSLSAETEKGSLQLIVEKIKNTKGYISVALCSNPEEYYNDIDIFMTAKITPKKGVTKYIFKDVPYGKYAIKVYHDKNNNGKLDTGFFGIPKEGYGFSNNPKIKGGMPSYEKTVFEFNSQNQTIKIRMK